MNTETESKFDTDTAIGAERFVFEALHSLPDGYQVMRPLEGLTVHGKDMVYDYEPDFIVSGPEGRTVMVEVKRPGSMSWSNLARFVQIDRSAREAGTAFLVLVPGEETEAHATQVPEFSEVKIAYANNEPAMAHAVLEALHSSPSVNQAPIHENDFGAASF